MATNPDKDEKQLGKQGPKRDEHAGKTDNPQIGKTISGDTGGEHGGRKLQHGQPDNAGTRGSSVQGPRQDSKGGPAGANQGGAPRGGSRLEPSHQQDRAKKDHSGKEK